MSKSLPDLVLTWAVLRLLEVGAVRPDNYGDCASWIDVTAIDLHSRHPSILEQDFLLMDASQHREAWDIISLSLVLNFVPEGKDRGTLILRDSQGDNVRVCLCLGRMLVQAHSMLRLGGLCFLAVRLTSFLLNIY